MHPCPKKDSPAFRRSRVDQPDGADTFAPLTRKFLCRVLLSRQRLWNGKVIFTKMAQEPRLCQQVAGIPNRPQYLAHGTDENGLIPPGATAQPTVNGTIWIPVSAHLKVCDPNRTLRNQRFEYSSAYLSHASLWRSMTNPPPYSGNPVRQTHASGNNRDDLDNEERIAFGTHSSKCSQ